MARLYVVEEHNPWPSSGDEAISIGSNSSISPAGPILDLLEQNPFGRFEKMRLSSLTPSGRPPEPDEPPVPYQRKKALKTLEGQAEGWIDLFAEEPIPLKGSIARGPWRNTVMLATANKHLQTVSHEQVFGYLQDLARVFPRFKRADIHVDSKLAEFYEENNLDWLPECFGAFLNWYYLISPLAYEPYFSREEMLAIPAYRVREVGAEEGDGKEGWVEVITYEDPLSYKEPATHEKIVEVTRYLNAQRHDHNLETGTSESEDEAQDRSAVEVA